MSPHVNNIIETYTSSASALNTTLGGWDTSKFKVLLAWGVDISIANLPPVFAVYQSSETQAAINTISFKFQSAVDVSTEPSKTLQIALGPSITVVQSSIFTDLPVYSGAGPVCAPSSDSRTIICTNVGKLLKSTLYTFSFRFSVRPLYSSSTLDPTFGTISLVTASPMYSALIPVSYTHLTLPTIYSV
eukprot:TRINITY_DN26116_c0_g1_i1.p1 TRINITY_DN26116_c0_g1~~TRINITY_DN26116_c0_g1_i1.p1  ORF type:complete len:188 (+),score=17.05 TRINITY_DN26116_c0_g1_i1:93-656(+)